MGKLQDLSAVLTSLYDQPLLGPKPDQLLIFKRPQLALKLQCLLQPASSAAAKHSNLSVVNQAIAAMYEHPALHVAGWAPVRSGQHNAEVHLSFLCTAQTAISISWHHPANHACGSSACQPACQHSCIQTAARCHHGAHAQCAWGHQRPRADGLLAEALSVWA